MAFENLTLIDAVNRSPADGATKRRRRLLMQIDKQIEIVNEFSAGRQKRGRWFQENQDGSISLAVRYGRRDLELSQGKFAISCNTVSEVLDALATVRLHCSERHFDTQLEKISGEIRKGFAKSPTRIKQTGSQKRSS